MRFVSYRDGDAPGVGVMIDDDSFVSLSSAAPDLPNSLRGILELGGDALARAGAAAQGRAADYRLDEVVLDPVIPEPHALWCLALNFQAHIDETGLTTNKYHPHIFLRIPASQVGHNQPIVKPTGMEFYDYEGEIAAIIGKPGRRIAERDAYAHVAGYAIYNEGSVREYQRHNRHFGLGKNFEKSGSFGPWMMTADAFGDPAKHTLITRLNGEEKQHCGLDLMIFSIAKIISYLSEGYTLRPGDVVVSGTPGALPGRKVNMQAGDLCEVEVTGLGILRNPVIAEG
jgi:2-keto-4-pentenoate hydratase/2-oxohepta-3-ene-1,7-dioic acid hydratase in catechol pathway